MSDSNNRAEALRRDEITDELGGAPDTTRVFARVTFTADNGTEVGIGDPADLPTKEAERRRAADEVRSIYESLEDVDAAVAAVRSSPA